MKKKIIALVLVVAMVAVSVIGGTLAYLTDSEEAVNVFTVGNIEIKLDEDIAVTSKNGSVDYTDTKVIQNNNSISFKNIMPGNKIKKTVTVTNDDNPAYVRVIVVLNNYDKMNKAIDDWYESKGYSADEIQAIYDQIFDGWGIQYNKTPNDAADEIPAIRRSILKSYVAAKDTTKTDVVSVDHVYRTTGDVLFSEFNLIKSEKEIAAASTANPNTVNPGNSFYGRILNEYELCYAYYFAMDKGDSVTLFNGLYCPEEFGNEQIKMFENLQIEVYADAIQQEGFTDAKAAFTALEEAHSVTELRDIRPTDLPVADVDDADQYENVILDWQNVGGFYPPSADQQLESVYKFEATDTHDEAAASPYADWITDYYVSLDRDLGPNQIVLGGEYGDFGWIGFSNGDITLEANTFMPLIGSVGFTFTYLDIVDYVSVFHCGVADINNALAGATFTVELRVTNPANPDEYYVINSTSYTFTNN